MLLAVIHFQHRSVTSVPVCCLPLAQQTGEGLAAQLEQQGQVLETTQQQLKEQQSTHKAAQQAHTDSMQHMEQQLKPAQQDLEASKQEVCVFMPGRVQGKCSHGP